MHYSSYQNQLFVGQNLQDTIRNVTFEQCLVAIPSPEKHFYLIDMKNLNKDNAVVISELIIQSAEKYGITNRLIVEIKH